MEVATGLGASPLDRPDVCRRLLQVLRPLRRRYDDACSVVGLQAAVQQVGARPHDPSRVQHVVNGHPVLHQRLGVVAGVVAVRHLDGGKVLALHAVLHHVTGKRERERLHRACQSVRSAHQVSGRHGRGAPSCAADTYLRVPVHGAEDGDDVAHARLNRADRQSDQCLRAGPSAGAVHVEVELVAEVVSQRARRGRVAAVVAQHPVDVLRRQPGVRDGVANGLHRKRPRTSPGTATVVGLADSNDAVFVTQVVLHNPLLASRQSRQTPASSVLAETI